MRIDQIAPAAFRLPARELSLFASSLWESIEEPYVAMVDLTDEDAISLALARDAELESGAVNSLSHVELMSRMRG